jgi:hypothetical protein
VHASIWQGRISDEFYATLQKILDKVNKNDYIMLIGDMNARVENSKTTNMEKLHYITMVKKTDKFWHI